ncbi:MAG: class I SAM-dependent RNA methyltransferase [Oscillospiraceae bacterium]
MRLIGVSMPETIRLTCPCHFGLESILSFEVKKIGGENVAVTDGKVSFTGDFTTLARANFCLSTAERVLIELGSFPAPTFEALFQGVKSLPLEDYIGQDDAFPVKGYALNSQLHSIPDCQKIIKKAAVERLKLKYGGGWFDESGAVHQMQFAIHKDVATIYLDTTGQGLHKRGYRRKSNDAPIKETLAAGIIDLARVRADSVVCDPMCGSGTLLIEAAFKACGIAPGIRRKFAAEEWKVIPSSIWETTREEVKSAINRTAAFRAFGSDIDFSAVELTIDNVKKAGVSSRIKVSQGDIKDFTPPPGAVTVCNPPYGERMLEIRQAEELYKRLGERLQPSASTPCVIISPHEDFEKFFGKKADRRRKLYNGMLKCQLFMYFKD